MNPENSNIISFSSGKKLASNVPANDGHHPDNHSPLKNGNGGGGGDMEARVAKLESDVEHIKATMSDMKSDLKTITSDVGIVKTDVALILQKMDNISSSVESKANTADVALVLQKMDSLSSTVESKANNNDVALILQRMSDMSSSIEKKSSSEQVDAKIGVLKIWFLTLLLFSIAMPVIMFLLNLYMKKP
ncbi:hypothetical protein Xsto_03815 [Xenorhabdus stockiae]|uniref:Uncharacterized protein n=1 Tax=Xenorhabdus stockiae TaxID=351614 RepID=A0A2D0KAZ8_9GAMM|nr:hypothetical protein [Xenorhabdus stockiae]PHM60616.1 hypothetical protein Xsto_03815 [Xenorhabdus stockiae]